MTVISISLTPDLLDQVDELVKNGGYSSRSELLRLAVRESLSQYALQKLKTGMVIAIVTALYPKELKEINNRLMDIRHEFDEYIHGNMHLHISQNFCLELYIFEGENLHVLNFVTKIRAVRGIREVKYLMSPFESPI